MLRADYRTHMLIGFEDKKYRVLDVGERVLVIDCIKKTMPMWKEYEELIHFEPMEELDRIDSENKFENLDDLNEKTKKVSYQKYNMISSIIPFISDEELRTTIIKKMADKYDVSVQTIRKYLCTYLSTMNIRSLAPDTRSTKKELSDDEKNIRKSLNKWYFTTKKRTLRNCYTLMLKNYYCDEDGKLLEEYPSFYQFRYFYRNYKKESTEMISRNTLSFYQRNQRPLVGDGVQGFAGTIGLVYLDATVCDLYLVNEAGELIGRPILTFGVDAFSGLICGYSLSWEGGMYSLRELMLNMISDKVEHCRKFGIEVTEEQWPSHQLPLKIFTDQGSEYKSMNFGQIIDLGVELTNLQSYRAELKGSVEKSFDVIQNYMAPYLKGNGRVEVDFQERGAHDYRKDACLTMNDFEKILLHCIIFYNSKRVEKIFVKGKVDSNVFLDTLIANGYDWHLGGMSDPLQPIEKDLHVTRNLLEVTNKYGIHILVSTKSNQIYGCDFRPELHSFQLSVSNVHDRTDIEPGVVTIKERYEFFRRLKDNGFKVGIRIQPFIPGITTTEIVEMFEDADHFTLEGIKLVPQNQEHRKECIERLNLNPSDFKQMGLLNLKPETRLELYKPFVEMFEKKHIPYSIADNDLHYLGTSKCCCGDALVNKTTTFSNTFMLHEYGSNYSKEDVDKELHNCGVCDCKCNQYFTSNRQEGCITVQDFYDKRFSRKNSPFSPQYQYIENN